MLYQDKVMDNKPLGFNTLPTPCKMLTVSSLPIDKNLLEGFFFFVPLVALLLVSFSTTKLVSKCCVDPKNSKGALKHVGQTGVAPQVEKSHKLNRPDQRKGKSWVLQG